MLNLVKVKYLIFYKIGNIKIYFKWFYILSSYVRKLIGNLFLKLIVFLMLGEIKFMICRDG